jgi:hypothetical protein
MQTRRRVRPAVKGRELERAYERLTGTRRPFREIALEIYDRTDSCLKVSQIMEQVYGVKVTFKTASRWINAALADREAADEREPEKAAA